MQKVNNNEPQLWRYAEIREFSLSLQPGFARQPNESNKGTMQLRMPSISRTGYIDFTISKYVDATDEERLKYAVKKGDVIFNNTNSPELVGNAAVFDNDIECVLSNHMTRIRVNPLIIFPGFLAAVLHSFWKSGQTQKRSKQWINQAAVDLDNLASFRIPLPPLNEQKRIVEILQEVEKIRRLRADAEAKSAALIPAIFENTFGDPGSNPCKWTLKPISALIKGAPKNGLYKSADFYGNGTPIIRIGDFSLGILKNISELQRLRISEDEIEQYQISNGQILINRVNSIEHLGKSLLLANLPEATVYESNMMRLDPIIEKVLPVYLIGCLQHPSILSKLRAKAKKAINQASINQTDIVTIQIPVPPLPAQQAYKMLLKNIEEILALSVSSFRLEKALRASVYAKAFSGQLTANWREANKDMLKLEIQNRKVLLNEIEPFANTNEYPSNSVVVSSSFSDITTTITCQVLRNDGIYSELNNEQRTILAEITSMFGRGENYGRYFTAKLLIDSIQNRNHHAIEGHLAVLAARGLIIPVSREEQKEDTGEFVYGNAFRLPFGETDIEVGGTVQFNDNSRVRELERLARQIEKERKLL